MVASSIPLDTPFGMTIAFGSIFSGSGFRFIGSAEPIWPSDEHPHDPFAELAALTSAASKEPKPTVLFMWVPKFAKKLSLLTADRERTTRHWSKRSTTRLGHIRLDPLRRDTSSSAYKAESCPARAGSRNWCGGLSERPAWAVWLATSSDRWLSLTVSDMRRATLLAHTGIGDDNQAHLQMRHPPPSSPYPISSFRCR